MVAIYRSQCASYPNRAPFHPGQRFPEAMFPEVSVEANHAYEAVRACLLIAGLDVEHQTTPAWNPLRGLIRPGETVLLKPNLIKERHPREPLGWQCMLTHGSIVRAVADYVWKALDGRGRIIVADAPQTDSSFDAVVRVLGLDAVRDFYRAGGLDFDLIDLRRAEWMNRGGVIVSRRPLPGDPRGNIAFDLGERSEFVAHGGTGRYYGADYDTGQVNAHHSQGRHEYLIAASAIECDVLFNLPKLKTHKKDGITVGLKNLVGINGDKNWMPHHTEGEPSDGGDEHPGGNLKHRAERAMIPYFWGLSRRIPGLGPWIYQQARRFGTGVFGDTEVVVRSGNWWGNDTVWRMCLDLNKLVLYGERNGSLRDETLQNRKRHYVLVDGLIAGEGRGPVNPDPVPAGLVVFGVQAVHVDTVCAWLMGFDPERIPIIRQAYRCRRYPLVQGDWRDVILASNQQEWNGVIAELDEQTTLRFEPHFGWKGRIERRLAREVRNGEPGSDLPQAADVPAARRL